MARKEKTGVELDLYVMSKCHELMMKLPEDSREATLDWLVKRVHADGEAKQADVPMSFEEYQVQQTRQSLESASVVGLRNRG